MCLGLVVLHAVEQLFVYLQFLLNLRLEAAVDEDTSPRNALSVNIGSHAVHQVVAPCSFVARSVRVSHPALAIHATLSPLAVELSARGECVTALPVHLVAFPHAFIFFGTVLRLTVLGTRESDLTLTMLDLATIGDLPLTDVESLVNVFESARAFLRHVGLIFLDLRRNGSGIFAS